MNTTKITEDKIKIALQCCMPSYNKNCEKCAYKKYKSHAISARTCSEELCKDLFDLLNRLQTENNELSKRYKNLSNANLQHAIDAEKDRQLLCEYQNIFLDLGYGTEVFDPELKEIKAWKDRMIWHCKRADELLAENGRLNKEIKEIKNKTRKEFVEKLKAEYSERFLVSGDTVIEILNDVLKEEETKDNA